MSGGCLASVLLGPQGYGARRLGSGAGQGEMRLPHSPPVLSPAQLPPSPKSHWTFLEPGLLHVKGRLQSAQPVQADGGPQWASATGAEGPGRAGELGWGPTFPVQGKDACSWAHGGLSILKLCPRLLRCPSWMSLYNQAQKAVLPVDLQLPSRGKLQALLLSRCLGPSPPQHFDSAKASMVLARHSSSPSHHS